MFDKNMKKAISAAVSLGVEKGMDLETAISETLELAESGGIPLDFKSDSNATIQKSMKVEKAAVDLEARTIEGYAATWDLDQVDDVIHKGAFSKSILERLPANLLKVLYQHDELIGKPLEMKEDDFGLWTKSYISDTPLGNAVLQMAADGVLDRLSIGFSIPRGKSEVDEKGIRHIYEAKLMEYSFVTFPANEAAIVTAVKEAFIKDVESKTSGEEIDQKKAAEVEELKEIQDSLKSISDFARLRLY